MSILPAAPGAKKDPQDKRSALRRATAVCDRILDGLSLGKACAAEGIDKRTFLRLLRGRNKKLAEAYAFAKLEGVEASLSDSDDGLAEAAELARKKGKAASPFVTAKIAIAKRAEWRAERLKARVYGTKVDHSLSGPNGGPIEITRIERTIVDPKA